MEDMTEELEKEYEEVFTDEEKVSHVLKLTSDSFTRQQETILIKTIGYTKPIQLGRKDTLTGLTSTVKDLGVVTPIHVMKVAEEEADDDYQYILLDGLRRVYAALKNGQTEIDAVVWDFEDKDKAMDVALTISLILNRTQRRTMAETWDLYKILEMQDNFTPGTLEYLLQLEGGDAMKLKDVMLCEYDEVKQALLSGEKNLDACYKLLQKLRKEENALEKEDAMGVDDISESAGEISGDNVGESGQLSDGDVRELLEMADDDSLVDISSEDFSELNQSLLEEEVQKVGERHPVDPAIRQGTFARDEYKCRCCGTGGVAFLGTLVYHHIIPVHCKGADTIDNGLTLCSTCHIQLHCAEKIGGRIPMTEEQFNDYSEADQIRIKKIIKYARVAVEAAKRQGISKEKIREEATKSARHLMPGEGLKENQTGFLKAGSPSVNSSNTVENDAGDFDDFDSDFE